MRSYNQQRDLRGDRSAGLTKAPSEKRASHNSTSKAFENICGVIRERINACELQHFCAGPLRVSDA